MAYEIPGQMITLKASTAILSTTSLSQQYRFVAVNASGQAVRPAVNANVVGVLQNKPRAENDSCTIMVNGVSKIVVAGGTAGSTLAAGESVATTTAGMARKVVAGAHAIGTVISGSSGSTGRVFTVLLQNIGTT